MRKVSVVLSVGVFILGLACSAQPPQPEAPSNIKIGTGVGERVPEFSMRLADRSTVTSADLVTTGKPVFIYFFATW